MTMPLQSASTTNGTASWTRGLAAALLQTAREGAARLSSMQRPKPDPYAFLALSEHTLRDIGLNRLGITVH
ncbi:MAG: hypothetical protein JOZ40_16785 [Methylobacteriaceae bacterium]|nr:hypothetical protein [Methylobacteriaceae bacterium]